jgi:dolichol-phosphate mannosyltransferase
VGRLERLGRLDIAALPGPIADILIFIAMTGNGMRPGRAHLISFGIATVVNYIFKVRGAVAAAGRARDLRLHVHLLLVSLFALFLRGGVLGLLINIWGWPAQVGIVFAAAAAVAVTLPGHAFALATCAWRLGSGTRWRVAAVSLVIGSFLLRLIYNGQIELFPEEPYYWNYAQHLDIGYLDHPPMVAWLIKLGTLVFGDTEFGVRIGAVCCAAVAAWFAYRLTRNLFGEASAVVALVLLQVLPFFFMAGMIMTPDAPLTAAWAASLYFLERALLGGQSRAWLLAGVSIGLGMISKYTIGLLVPAMLLFVLLDRQSRRWLFRWEPFAALAIALVIFSPVIVWNAEHEWASFAFQTSRRLAEAPRFAFHKLLLSMLVLLTPTGFLTLVVSRFARETPGVDEVMPEAGGARGGANGSAEVSTGETASGAESGRRWLFVRVAVLVPLSVFAVFSLRHDVKIDWTGALWLAAVPAMAASIVAFGKAGVRGVRAWTHSAWGPTAIIIILLYGACLHYLTLGLPGVGYSKHVELLPVGWRDLGRQINAIADDIRKRTGMEPVIVGMDRYEMASQLTFYAPDHARSVRETSSRNVFGEGGLMYERWFSPSSVGNRTVILVAWDPHDISDEPVKTHAAYLSAPQEGVVTRDGVVVTHYFYRFARGVVTDPAP